MHFYCLMRHVHISPSELIIVNVQVEAKGVWECVVSTGRGNASSSVEIVVLENNASFCPEDKIVNNRGEFRFVKDAMIVLFHLGPWVLMSVFNFQVAQYSGRHHLPTVLSAAALPLLVYWGRHWAEKGLPILWSFWKVAGGELHRLSLYKWHHPCPTYFHFS